MRFDAEKLAKIYVDNMTYRGYYDLYHYTNIESMEKILQIDNVVFRMTNINNFDDKMESKSI